MPYPISPGFQQAQTYVLPRSSTLGHFTLRQLQFPPPSRTLHHCLITITLQSNTTLSTTSHIPVHNLRAWFSSFPPSLKQPASSLALHSRTTARISFTSTWQARTDGSITEVAGAGLDTGLDGGIGLETRSVLRPACIQYEGVLTLI
jgi:hypothetical protein